MARMWAMEFTLLIAYSAWFSIRGLARILTVSWRVSKLGSPFGPWISRGEWLAY
jgi:hypothetical protein